MRIERVLLLALAFAAGCGSGSSSGSTSGPSALSYAENPAIYTQGFTIAPNEPTVTGAVSDWSVLPALPTGLSLGATGEITGTPLVTLPATDFTVTASNSLGSTDAIVNISVVAPQPRALYVANLTDNTIASFHVDGMIHSGYAISPGNSPRALAARPDGAFVYAANNASDDISTFTVDAVSGRLTDTGTVVAAGSQPSVLATDITGSFLFSADQGGDSISTFTIDAGVPVAASSVGTGGGPSALALSPTGATLYVANSLSDDVERFAVDPATGALTSAGVIATGIEPSGLAVATTPAGAFLYATNSTSGSISQWSIDPATGALTALVPATVAAGFDPRDLIAHPEGTFLYVANRASDTIGMYAIDQGTGALSPLGTPTIASGVGPTALAIDPAGSSLYVCTEFDREVSEYAIAIDGGLTLVTSVRTRGNPIDLLLGPAEMPLQISSDHAYVAAAGSGGNVAQFAVDIATFGLTALSPASVATAGPAPRGVAVHPGGELILASSETGFNLSLYTRDTDTGELVLAGSQAANNTSDVKFEPTGRFAYATHRLIGVQPYEVDVATPDLTPLTTATVGVDPRGFDIDPTGQFLYLSDTSTGVFMFRITATTGELAAQGSIAAAGGTVAVAVHPSGRWAYATNGTANSISKYSVDGADGSLTALGTPSISTGIGTTPVGMDFSPDGTSLYVAYAGTDQVARFSVDAATGLLTPAEAYATFAEQPQALAVDATGTMVTVANTGSGGVLSLFSRDPATGLLNGEGFAGTDGAPSAVTYSIDLK